MNRFITILGAIIFLLNIQTMHATKPTIIIGLISNNIFSIEKYDANEFTGTLSREIRKQHQIFSLDLADIDCRINSLECNSTTQSLIKLSEQGFTHEKSFFINWGASIGINIADYQTNFISFIPWQHHEIPACSSVSIKSNESTIKTIYALDDTMHEEIVRFDCPLDGICGVIIAHDVNIAPNKNLHTFTFQEALEQGIVIPNEQIILTNKQCEIDQEAEFDALLDSMCNDGVIKIQPSSRLFGFIERIGGNLFVKYLTVKGFVYTFFHKLFSNTNRQAVNGDAAQTENYEQKRKSN